MNPILYLHDLAEGNPIGFSLVAMFVLLVFAACFTDGPRNRRKW